MVKSVHQTTSLVRGLRVALLGLDVERRAELEGLAKADHGGCDRNDLVPQLDFVRRDPAQLHLPKRNVRGLKPSHVKEVANSIARLGFSVPVLIDQHGSIIDGVVRVHAALTLGLG